MKKNLSNILLVLVFIAGLSLLLYPTISDWYNSWQQSRRIVSYTSTVSGMSKVSYKQYWDAARDYNARLAQNPNRFHIVDDPAAMAEYNSLLNVGGSGIMGRIKVPKLGIEFPLYHGTSEGVLQIAIGHIEGTSLPIGGKGTHCAVSGHRGLPSARLFTDLDDMEVGDTFMLYILDEVLTYQVDQIKIVLPHEMEELAIDPEQDYCTLVTCTPYGINSHRMLVRGTRIEGTKLRANITFTSDATLIEPFKVALGIGGPCIFLWMLGMMLMPAKKTKKHA